MQKLKTIAFILLILGSITLLLFIIPLLFGGSGLGGVIAIILLAVLGFLFFLISTWLFLLKFHSNENQSKYGKLQLFVIYLIVLPLFILGL